MPTVQVYLNQDYYLKLLMEADRNQMRIGQFSAVILKNYLEYVEKGQVTKK